MILSPELEYLAYTNKSFLRELNPITKLILLICLLVINLTAKLGLELFLFTALILLFWVAKVSFRAIKRPLLGAILLSFALFLAKLHFLKTGVAVTVLIDFYPRSCQPALLSALKVLCGVMTILIFVATTPLYDVLSALAVLKVPKTVIDIFLVIYKYIFIINDEGIRTKNAQEVRLGYSSFRASLESFGNLAGLLILRSVNKGERMIDALNVRGYRGEMFFPVKIKSLIFLDYLLIALLGILPLVLNLLWMR